MTRWRWSLVVGVGAVVVIAVATWLALPHRTQTSETPKISALPLSDTALAGKALFERSCAECHGPTAAGNDKGPPLVHRLYHPSHHGDAAFELAVRRGVRAHHWRFGDMASQPSVTAGEVAQITRYVRELQKASGVY